MIAATHAKINRCTTCTVVLGHETEISNYFWCVSTCLNYEQCVGRKKRNISSSLRERQARKLKYLRIITFLIDSTKALEGALKKGLDIIDNCSKNKGKIGSARFKEIPFNITELQIKDETTRKSFTPKILNRVR